jgi:type IV pilus assembly protein PilB
MHEKMLQRVHNAVDTPGTIVLFSGPPASGKSSTCHAALTHIDIFTTDITTLESNPAHDLDQIKQHQVDVSSKPAVEELLPSVLRHGADVIGIDEITDPESISPLLDFVADDGRLIGTIKASSTPEALSSFTQPLDSTEVAQTLETVVSQRLVRTLCRNCREQYDPNPKLLKKLKIKPGDVGTWFRAVGCGKCLQTGYKGQTAIFEILTLNDTLRKLIAQGHVRESARIKKTAGKSNLTTLFQDALSKVQDGTTTLDEIRRVLK